MTPKEFFSPTAPKPRVIDPEIGEGYGQGGPDNCYRIACQACGERYRVNFEWVCTGYSHQIGTFRDPDRPAILGAQNT